MLLTTRAYVREGIGGIARYSRQQIRNLNQLSKGRFKIISTLLDERRPAEAKKDVGMYHNLTEYSLMPSRKNGALTLSTAHEFQILLHPELSTPPVTTAQKLEYPRRRQGLLDILKSDFMIANSTQTVKEAVLLGYDKRKIFVVNPGVKNELLRRSIPGRHNGRFVAGYLGAIRYRKNLDFAFRAFDRLDKRYYRFEMYGVLFRDFKAQLHDYLKSNKGFASYNGIVPESKLVSTYDSFDALIMPSKYEGFGLGIVEAQSRGVPVIICKDSIIPEEIRRFCIVAEDEDHAAQLLEDLRVKGYNKRLQMDAIRHYRKFTWERTARETIGVYEKILGLQ